MRPVKVAEAQSRCPSYTLNATLHLNKGRLPRLVLPSWARSGLRNRATVGRLVLHSQRDILAESRASSNFAVELILVYTIPPSGYKGMNWGTTTQISFASNASSSSIVNSQIEDAVESMKVSSLFIFFFVSFAIFACSFL